MLSVKCRGVDLQCPGRADSSFIPVLGEAQDQKCLLAPATPKPGPAGACHLRLTRSPRGVYLLKTPGVLSLPHPSHNHHLCSASPTPRAGSMGTQSCSYTEQMVLIKGANEFQALCDCAGRAGGQAQHSPYCLGRYQRPPPLVLALRPQACPQRAPGV